jgi:hypothetical protein
VETTSEREFFTLLVVNQLCSTIGETSGLRFLFENYGLRRSALLTMVVNQLCSRSLQLVANMVETSVLGYKHEQALLIIPALKQTLSYTHRNLCSQNKDMWII